MALTADYLVSPLPSAHRAHIMTTPRSELASSSAKVAPLAAVSTSSSSSSSASSSLSTRLVPMSTAVGAPPLPPSHGWSELPFALFDRVCSQTCLPVFDILSSLSTICRQWRQLVNDKTSDRFDCWRHVPPVRVRVRMNADYLTVQHD